MRRSPPPPPRCQRIGASARSSLAASRVYTAFGAVRMRSVGRAGHLSRILSRTVIPPERRSPSASSGLPGDGAGHAMVPLRGLAPGSACPFHPACAGSSLWRWPRLTAEGRYPLPCPVESGLSSAAFADATVGPTRRGPLYSALPFDRPASAPGVHYLLALRLT